MGATTSRNLFHGGKQATAVNAGFSAGPRQTLELHQLRSLDIVMMSSKTFLLGIPVRDEMARSMANRIQALHLDADVSLDRWDRVGIVSIDEKAMEDGVTYDTVNVIMATAYGIRSVTLRAAMEMSSEICVRPLFFPGEPPKRSPAPTPHPMRVANSLGTTFAAQKHRRTRSGIRFSNDYSLPLADDASDPLNALAHSDTRAVRRRQLHARLLQYLQPLLSRSYTDARVQVELAALLQWLALRLLAAHVQPDHQQRMKAAVEEYAARRAALRNEAEQCAKQVRQRLRARLREGDLIHEYMRGIVDADVGFDPQAERDRVLEEVRRERERTDLAGAAAGTSAAMAAKAVEERKKKDDAARRAREGGNGTGGAGSGGGRRRHGGGGGTGGSRAAAARRAARQAEADAQQQSQSQQGISVRTDDVEFEDGELKYDDYSDGSDGGDDEDDDDDDDYDLVNWSPDELQYVDLLGLFGHLVSGGAGDGSSSGGGNGGTPLRVLFNDEEVYTLIDMFLSRPGANGTAQSILASEFLRQWTGSLERNAETSKLHGALLSAGFVCLALQHLSILPGGLLFNGPGGSRAADGGSNAGDAAARSASPAPVASATAPGSSAGSLPVATPYAASAGYPHMAASLAESQQYLFPPSSFFQGSPDVQGALTGALLGREHVLPPPKEQPLEVLDAEALRLKELRAAAQRAEVEAAKREAEKRRKKEDWERARVEQERKRRALEAASRKQALADALAKQIADDEAEKARAEEAARQEERDRFREAQMREFEARRAKKRADKEQRQAGMSAMDRMLDIDGEDSEEEEQEAAAEAAAIAASNGPSAGGPGGLNLGLGASGGTPDSGPSDMSSAGVRGMHGKRFFHPDVAATAAPVDAGPTEAELAAAEAAAEASRAAAAEEEQALLEQLRLEDEAALAERRRAAAELGGERPVLITFSATNLPSHLAERDTFATLCAVWSAEPGQDPTLVAYTPAVPNTLNPDYQAACMLAFAPQNANFFDVLICVGDGPQDLGDAPVVGRATIDLIEVLRHPVGVGQPPVVYALKDPQHDYEVGSLEVLQFTEEMGDLVLFLGGESSIFEGDNGAVLCTYDGLAALLAAAGGDLQSCLNIIRSLESGGLRFASMAELATAIAVACPRGAFPASVRGAVFQFLTRRNACGPQGMLGSVVETIVPASLDPLLRACPDVHTLLGRLVQLEAEHAVFGSLKELAESVELSVSSQAAAARAKPVDETPEEIAHWESDFTSYVGALVLELPDDPVAVIHKAIGSLIKRGGMLSCERLFARTRTLEECGFKFLNWGLLAAALMKV